MHRGLLTQATFFKVMQLDALFSETVTIPEGLYTPELIQQIIRSNISSDTAVDLDHVDEKEVARDGWVRWTFRSTEDHPFTLDFSNQSSALAARILGFRQRRYTGRVMYRGTRCCASHTQSCPRPRPLLPYPEAQEAPFERDRRGVRLHQRFVHGHGYHSEPAEVCRLHGTLPVVRCAESGHVSQLLHEYSRTGHY